MKKLDIILIIILNKIYQLAHLIYLCLKKKISDQCEKVLNLVDFMNQKYKCKIQNYFDQKASKKFLESKDIAMKKIYLDDEIISTKSQHDISDEIKEEKKTKKDKNKK